VSYHPDPIRSLRASEEFSQARLIGITRGAIAVGLDPTGMLGAQVVVDLPLEFGVIANVPRHLRTFGCNHAAAIAHELDFQLPLLRGCKVPRSRDPAFSDSLVCSSNNGTKL